MCPRGPPPTLAAMPSPQPPTAASAAAALPHPLPWAHAHKALRHALAALLQRLGTLDPHDDAQVQATVRELRALLDHQALQQRLAAEHLYPALEAHQPGLTAGAAHAAAEAAQHAAALLALAGDAGACGEPAARAALLDRLYQAFAQHTAQQLHHMAHEAQALAPPFQAHVDGAALHALQRLALASLARWQRLDLLQRLADGLNPDELAALLLAHRDDGAPEAWLAGAMAVQGRVGATRWAAIAARLQSAGALPAAR